MTDDGPGVRRRAESQPHGERVGWRDRPTGVDASVVGPGESGDRRHRLRYAASSDFSFLSEFGWLSPTREAIGAGVFDEESAVSSTPIRGPSSAFVTDTLDVTLASARDGVGAFQLHDVRLRDQLGIALNGDHSFARSIRRSGVTADVTPR